MKLKTLAVGSLASNAYFNICISGICRNGMKYVGLKLFFR